MIKIKRTLPFFLALLFLTACVSKKKYLQMESQKNRYLKESRQLKSKVNSLNKTLKITRADFDLMKTSLLASNAAKMDSLNEVIVKLTDIQKEYSDAQANLQKTKSLVKDQTYYNSKSRSEINRLNIALKQLSRDTVSLNYSLKLQRKKVEQYKEKLNERVAQINDKNIELNSLRKDLVEKDKSIASIQKDVDALKSKIGAVSTSFIELRKQLLRAKTSGTAIDPNNNKHINAISKDLGHY